MVLLADAPSTRMSVSTGESANLSLSACEGDLSMWEVSAGRSGTLSSVEVGLSE